MTNYNNADNYKKSNLDKKTLDRLDFRKEELEKRREQAELQKRKTEQQSILKDIELKKRKIKEGKYIMRRLETEIVRVEKNLNDKIIDKKRKENDLQVNQNNIERKKQDLDRKLEILFKEIEKIKKDILEKEKQLNDQLFKKNELEKLKDRESLENNSIVSRLEYSIEKDLKFIETTRKKYEEYKNRINNLKKVNSSLIAEITILENKHKAIERNIKK